MPVWPLKEQTIRTFAYTLLSSSGTGTLSGGRSPTTWNLAPRGHRNSGAAE